MMNRTRPAYILIWLIVTLYISFVGLSFAEIDDAGLGRSIFEGRGAAAAIIADIGGRPGNAGVLPCNSCHGLDGSGRREADAIAPAILRGEGGLDRIGITSNGEIRPAYDINSFASVLNTGVAPNGRLLSGRMPRYEMNRKNAYALWDWLAQLPIQQRIGVDEDSLNFSVIDSKNSPRAQAFAAELRGLAAISKPIYGRKLRFEAELEEGDGCVGERSLALIIVSLSDFHDILQRASFCGIPAIIPFGAVIGTEHPYELRAMSASLLQQWEELSRVAGSGALVYLPPNASDWQVLAIRRAGLKPSDPAELIGGKHVLVPFGLDGAVSLPPDAVIFAPAVLSLEGVGRFLNEGRSIRLSVSPLTDDGKLTDAANVTATLAKVLVAAARLAGPDLTQAAFIEAFDQVRVSGNGMQTINYSESRLTGTRSIGIIAISGQ